MDIHIHQALLTMECAGYVRSVNQWWRRWDPPPSIETSNSLGARSWQWLNSSLNQAIKPFFKQFWRFSSVRLDSSSLLVWAQFGKVETAHNRLGPNQLLNWLKCLNGLAKLATKPVCASLKTLKPIKSKGFGVGVTHSPNVEGTPTIASRRCSSRSLIFLIASTLCRVALKLGIRGRFRVVE